MGIHTSAFCSGGVCGKAPAQPFSEQDLFDDTRACDPAGAVFQDTLEDLSEVDRLLLDFASSTNLAVVRWLFVLGANPEACDSNRTTGLHAACRSGSLPVVRELLARGLAVDAADAGGWTALHVACFMGRRKVAVDLMLAGANLTVRNLRGFTPRGLCSDEWLRSAISSCMEHRRNRGSFVPWHFELENLTEDVQVSSRLHFEPFFVPRAPVLQDINAGALVGLGIDIFTHRPGQGLAFLVSTGCVRDYPVELSTFLMANRIGPQVGEFLGEDFSLSQTLRLEFINSVQLVGLSVVLTLTKVFQNFQIPSDLHKLNRLLEGTAQIWWRQHEQVRLESGDVVNKVLGVSRPLDGGDEAPEVSGTLLMEQLVVCEMLHQLMLSVIFLHWSLYAPISPSRRVTRAQWIDMNSGIFEVAATSIHSENIRQLLCRIYHQVSHTFFPQLQIWLQKAPSTCNWSNAPAAQPKREVCPKPKAGRADGWGLLVGCSLPAPAGATADAVTYRHIRSILSETTATTLSLVSPNTSRSSRQAPHEHYQTAEVHPRTSSKLPTCNAGTISVSCGAAPIMEAVPSSPRHGGRSDQVWLSLRQGLLFLAPRPDHWAPYAFLHLRGVVIEEVNRSALTVALAMKKDACGLPIDAANKLPAAVDGVSARPQKPSLLQLVFLLPDGRWQLLDVPQLQVQLLDLEHLDRWTQELEVQSGHANKMYETLGSASDDDVILKA